MDGRGCGAARRWLAAAGAWGARTVRRAFFPQTRIRASLSDSALSRWQVLLAVLVPWAKRLFVFVLVLFTIALVSNLYADGSTSPDTWFYWKPFRGALVFSSVVLGLVQLLAMGVLVAHNVSRSETRRLLHPALLRANALSILTFLWFEWTVINITSLCISLSTVGLPWFGYSSFKVGFAVTFLSLLVQYVISVYHYVRRRPFLTWRLHDCYVVVLPITVVLLGSGVLFLVTVMRFDVGQQIRNYLATCIVLGLFTLVVPPIILYRFVLHRASRAARSSPSSATADNRVPSEVDRHVRARCEDLKVRASALQSLMLVGLDLCDIEGLGACASLRRLYLTNNRITSCRGLEALTFLETLHLDDNAIADWVALVPLRGLPRLRRVSVERNPLFAADTDAHARLIALLPRCTSVNGLTVTDDARSAAATAHGPWLHSTLARHRAETFRRQTPPRVALSGLVAGRLGWQGHPVFARGSLCAIARDGDDATLLRSLASFSSACGRRDSS